MVLKNNQHELLSSDYASETFFRETYSQLYFLLYRWSNGNSQLTQDICQSAIERYIKYKAYEKVESKNDAKKYLFRIARNSFYSHTKKNGNEEEYNESIHFDMDNQSEELNIYKDILDELMYARERLSEEETQLFDLLAKDTQLSEIASKLDITYSTAAVRTFRLREKLKKYVKNY